jgi:hypothetical protein
VTNYDTAGIPTDAEVIALLRTRLTTVDDAIHDFLEVLERTGNERRVSYEAINRAQPGHGIAAAFDFLSVYERTMPERNEASLRLRDALVTDFRTALLCAADSTPEQIEYWLGKDA